MVKHYWSELKPHFLFSSVICKVPLLNLCSQSINIGSAKLNENNLEKMPDYAPLLSL